ncbi:hypothetical protein IFM89_025717 [Coptis chinensis]|uniref:LTI65/LTI78 PGEED repeat domain-containing protein n=1 Tax=Coptis chinensis TaxID=261450 RepID=A0A835HCY8_9MAGN|nr:hypothetical protein IFM89_025717 [Coptis chinensis]
MAAFKLGYGSSSDSTSSTGAELNKGGENEPLYGKEAGAGSAVISKIPGTGMITQKNMDEGIGVDTNMGTGSHVDTGRGVGETNKGVASVKGRKLAMGQGVSDAFHKRNSKEEMDRENKPMGKVTESEKVVDQLGSSESEKGGHVSGNDSPGKGVVEKLKGAFTSWFGKVKGYIAEKLKPGEEDKALSSVILHSISRKVVVDKVMRKGNV